MTKDQGPRWGAIFEGGRWRLVGGFAGDGQSAPSTASRGFGAGSVGRPRRDIVTAGISSLHKSRLRSKI